MFDKYFVVSWLLLDKFKEKSWFNFFWVFFVKVFNVWFVSEYFDISSFFRFEFFFGLVIFIWL